MIHCVKMYASADGLTFSTFGRVYSGSVKPGEQVRVLGEGYMPENDEDMAVATVEAVFVPRGRTRTEVTIAKAGNWVSLTFQIGFVAETPPSQYPTPPHRCCWMELMPTLQRRPPL